MISLYALEGDRYPHRAALPGYFLGPQGFAAFTGIKFSGYALAGIVLRRVYPATRAGVFKIAITRTVVGLAVGIPNLALWAGWGSQSAIGKIFPFFLVELAVLRLIVGTLFIHFFCDPNWYNPGRTMVWTAVGCTALSFLLDVVGMAL